MVIYPSSSGRSRRGSGRTWRQANALVLFTAVFGGLAVISAIAVSVGGSTRASSVLLAVVLGVVALSYAVLIWFKVFTRPLLRHTLP